MIMYQYDGGNGMATLEFCSGNLQIEYLGELEIVGSQGSYENLKEAPEIMEALLKVHVKMADIRHEFKAQDDYIKQQL